MLALIVFIAGGCTKIRHRKVVDLEENFDSQGAWQLEAELSAPNGL